jgi:hypothetical protein
LQIQNALGVCSFGDRGPRIPWLGDYALEAGSKPKNSSDKLLILKVLKSVLNPPLAAPGLRSYPHKPLRASGEGFMKQPDSRPDRQAQFATDVEPSGPCHWDALEIRRSQAEPRGG